MAKKKPYTTTPQFRAPLIVQALISDLLCTTHVGEIIMQVNSQPLVELLTCHADFDEP